MTTCTKKNHRPSHLSFEMQGLQILPCLLGHTSASRNQPSTPLLTLSSKIKSKAKLREYYIIITINAKGEINYS